MGTESLMRSLESYFMPNLGIKRPLVGTESSIYSEVSDTKHLGIKRTLVGTEF